VKFNQVNPVYLQTDVDKIVNKRKQLETDIPKQQIHNKIDVKLEVSVNWCTRVHSTGMCKFTRAKNDLLKFLYTTLKGYELKKNFHVNM